MSSPVVSVVMSVFNGGQYLEDAVQSILGQTFKDFEFIIIDDGSTDQGPKILKKFADQDTRIKLVTQKNHGLVASLNSGIKKAAGRYIARQDADDKSDPQRLAKQVEFLQSRADVVAVGSSIRVMDQSGNVIHKHAVLLNDPELRQELLVRSPFAHGSVIFKKHEALKAGLYDRQAYPAEDYDLWLRLSRYGRLANLDEYLYTYREHGGGVSGRNSAAQQQKLRTVQDKAWKERAKLLPKARIDMQAYKTLDMGQLRIERIIDNNVFISKKAWKNNNKSLAFSNMRLLAGDKITYRKVAGKLRRRTAK